MGKKPKGICRLCGEYKKMSFEHIPPKKAFNEKQKLFQTMQDMLEDKSHSKFRRGIGRYSLCERCNNLTGAWYGAAFVEWVQQGMDWLGKLGTETQISIPFYVKPLNVIKQILVMAMAMASEQTLDYHYELRRILLNKEERYLPPKYNVHIYFNQNGQPRFASDMVVTRFDTGAGSYIEAEVAIPPFGYCISKPVRNMKSLANEQRLCDITWFAQFDYDIWTQVWLSIPMRETVEPLPLDYRSEEEVDDHYQKMGITKSTKKQK